MRREDEDRLLADAFAAYERAVEAEQRASAAAARAHWDAEDAVFWAERTADDDLDPDHQWAIDLAAIIAPQEAMVAENALRLAENDTRAAEYAAEALMPTKGRRS